MIQQAYVEGVSTRRVDDLVKSLGCDGISKSQVSRPPQADRDLDQVVENFLGRPLDGGPYPYVWLDALTQKVRAGRGPLLLGTRRVTRVHGVAGLGFQR